MALSRRSRLPKLPRVKALRGLPPLPQVRSVRTPEQAYQELFHDVQMRSHGDSKVFVDAVPLAGRAAIIKAYQAERAKPDFDLDAFITRYFTLPRPISDNERREHDMSQHISELWPRLTRQVDRSEGSLLSLPYPYIVPGGRFNEHFYWDSYFIMLGLAAEGHVECIGNMVRNFTHQLHKYGYIPTANRTYLLSRSQPPYFSRMIRLLAVVSGNQKVLVTYLPYLLLEYRFWMRGKRKLSSTTPSYKRVVRMPDSSVLNRYYDGLTDPRPESYPEDLKTAELAIERQAVQVYLDVRAAAESGWDFSSRWFRSRNLETIHTTDYVPIDLNCLLYELELTIAESYRLLKQSVFAKRFEAAAERRAAAIRTYLWDEAYGLYSDYDHVSGRLSRHLTIAGVYALASQVATREQAERMQQTIRDKFLRDGGVVTTLISSGQQWDAPNGWAPLQWETIQGLRQYGYNELADEVKRRFLACAQLTYDRHHKLVEKYNVEQVGEPASGGEYALQDGFGWTNGVIQALLHEHNTEQMDTD